MYTYGGDANLDGKINVDDYGRIDLNIRWERAAGTTAISITTGRSTSTTTALSTSNVGIQGAPFSTSSTPLGGVANATTFAAVPEPSSLALLLSGVATLVRRRKRGCRSC
jgi:hypothetical protein